MDSLRGLAALTVVLCHFQNVFRGSRWQTFWDASPLRIVTAGHEAVVLFFLLSGFVLAVPFSRRHAPSYPAYLVKRVCRIWLPYLAAVGLALVGDALLHSAAVTGNPWIDHTWSQKPTIHLVVQHIIMIRNFDYSQLNTAFWSLVYEMRISIIFPVLFWLSLRMRARILVPLVFLVSIAAAMYSARHTSGNFSYDVLVAAFFVVGIVLQRSMPHIAEWFLHRSVAERAGLVVVALLCFDGPGAFPEVTREGWVLPSTMLREWVMLVGAVGILAFAINLNAFRHFLHTAPLLRLGKISYSIYLVHGTVLFTLLRMFYGSRYFGWLLPVYLLVTYLMAEGLHAGVERPAIWLGRRLADMAARRNVAGRVDGRLAGRIGAAGLEDRDFGEDGGQGLLPGWQAEVEALE